MTGGSHAVNYLAQGCDLAGMPRGMLGGVKDETEHRRRQSLPADFARLR